MKKDIYKITNIINGKCYIGQTTDAKRRFQQHKHLGYGNQDNKVLYYAINKYGINNFTFEIIESQVENYNERERYWIKYYDSYENGYNETEGGENPPLNIRENSPFATHTEEDVTKVKDLILHTDKTFKEIAIQTGYDSSTIERINKGILWNDSDRKYPLRPGLAAKKDRSELIIDDLLNSTLSQKEIAKKYNCSRTTVTAINNGQNFFNPNLKYPLRKRKQNYDYTKNICMVDKNTNQILNVFKSISEAGHFLGTSGQTITRCLKGEQKTAYGYKWKYEENN